MFCAGPAMYKIIGADGQEYGPVPEDQIRKWIGEGRADARTRARSGEAEAWKPLSEFPEFAAALAARRAMVAPPRIGSAETDSWTAEILARDYRLDIGDCFSRSWQLIQQEFWMLVGGTAVAVVLSSLLGFVPVLGIPAAVLLAFVLQGGVHWLFLQRLRGRPADMSAVFAGFGPAFLPLLLAGLVAHVLIGLGFFMLVLPGIYLAVSWRMFVPLLIIDKGLDFWPAMEVSRKVVTRHWWVCFGLFLLAWLVGFLGAAACLVGVFVTLPIAAGAIVCAYEAIFGGQVPGPGPGRLAPVPEPAPPAPMPPAPSPAPEAPTPVPPAPAAPPPAPPESAPSPAEAPTVPPTNTAPADTPPMPSTPPDWGPPAGPTAGG